MSFSLKQILAATFLLVLSASCRKEAAGRVERVAVLPFDNLSGDTGLDWISVAAPRMWQAQLSGQPASVAHVMDRASEAPRVDATQQISGYFFKRGGALRGTLIVEDAVTHSTKTIVVENGDAVGLIDSLSAQLGLPLRNLPTRNGKALALYGRSFASRDKSEGVARLEGAVKEDPSFGVAWLELATRTGGDQVAARALAQKAIPPLERAALAVRAMPPTATAAERLAKFAALAELYPADIQLANETAEFATTARRLDVALRWYTKITQLRPASIQTWNSKAYSEAFLGDFEAAKKSLERYRELSPNDANVDDSIGEIYYMSGRFAEAEASFKAAFAKKPSFIGGNTMRKAAWARLRAGDVKGASSNYAEFIAFRKGLNDPSVELRLGQWEYLSGNRAAAKARLEKLASDAKHPAAAGQLSIWARSEGDRSKAEDWARKSIQSLPAAPQLRGVVGVAATLAQPDATAEVWKARFGGHPYAAVGMMASGHYEEAALHLAQARSKMNPLQEFFWRDLEAIALNKAGKKDQARKLLATYSLPETEEDAVVLCFAYPADAEARKQLGK